MVKRNFSHRPLQRTLRGHFENDHNTSTDALDLKLRVFELYSQLQVMADTSYYYRTSMFTLVEGLLLIVFQAVVSRTSAVAFPVAIAVGGFVLTALWFFFEQRNQAYFRGRGAVLVAAENDLVACATRHGIHVERFWSAVSAWVQANAKWYERVSAPKIQYKGLPAIFAAAWVGLAGGAPRLVSTAERLPTATAVSRELARALPRLGAGASGTPVCAAPLNGQREFVCQTRLGRKLAVVTVRATDLRRVVVVKVRALRF